MENLYEVIVGNIGTVYSGNSLKEALQTYKWYADEETKPDRTEEEVVLFEKGEIKFNKRF